MRSKQSMVLPIGLTIVISAIVFGGLGYSLARQAQPQSDFSFVSYDHSYINKKYGFSFGYPHMVVLKNAGPTDTEPSEESVEFDAHILRQNYREIGYPGSLNVTIYEPSPSEASLSAEEFINKNAVNVTEKKKVKLGNIDAIQVSFADTGGYRFGEPGHTIGSKLVGKEILVIAKHKNYFVFAQSKIYHDSPKVREIITFMLNNFYFIN